jgi:helicase
MRLDEIEINERIITHLQKRGITKLFEPQEEAMRTGVLQGDNLVLAVPTSSGKTLVAELSIMKTILDGRGRALYLVPLKSLAREKYEDFKEYEELGITVAMSVGDYDSPGTKLRDADIVILTTERADSLIRHKTEWIGEVGIVIADEIHLINDASRGPTLEMVLAKLLQTLDSVQIVALSATISNADQIADWLGAKLVKSEWRPVPLNEGVYLSGEITFADGKKRRVPLKRREELVNVICDTLDEDGQVLVFVSSRRSTVAAAKRLVPHLRPYLSDDNASQLIRIAKRISSGPSKPEASKTLARLISNGAAFHHAGLQNTERALVEDAFKDNLLKVIVATPTLAAGVNLPARRVVIRDYRRYERGLGSYPIPVLEYKQMAGRAGRPKYDTYGEALLLARSESEKDDLFDNYTLSEPEEIQSKLASPTAVRFHLLASIASNMTRNRKEIDELMSTTFFACQFETTEIDDYVTSALDFLLEGDLVLDDGGRYSPTALGKRSSQLYINPETAILFRDVLAKAEDPANFGLLHLICHSPDQPKSYVTRGEAEECEIFIDDNLDKFLIEPPFEDSLYVQFLGEVKTARILVDWISERSEKDLTDTHNIGMGDVHRFVQSADWLSYAASEVARITGASSVIDPLRNLRPRIRYGVKNELLELVRLKGIGRVRGRMLYNYAYRTLADLHTVPANELARVPTIGTAVATSVKKQLGIQVELEDIEPARKSIDEDLDSVQTLLEDFS